MYDLREQVIHEIELTVRIIPGFEDASKQSGGDLGLGQTSPGKHVPALW
jgi:hypothetical protein